MPKRELTIQELQAQAKKEAEIAAKKKEEWLAKVHKEAAASVKEIEVWNAEANRIADNLQKVLQDKFPESNLDIQAESFAKLNEKPDVSYWSHRNYLSKEKLIVKIGGRTELYYFGEFDDLRQFKAFAYVESLNILKEQESNKQKVA